MVSTNTYTCKGRLRKIAYRLARRLTIGFIVVIPTIACSAIFGYGLAELIGLPDLAAALITIVVGLLGGGAYLRNLCRNETTVETIEG